MNIDTLKQVVHAYRRMPSGHPDRQRVYCWIVVCARILLAERDRLFDQAVQDDWRPTPELVDRLTKLGSYGTAQLLGYRGLTPELYMPQVVIGRAKPMAAPEPKPKRSARRRLKV